MKYLVYRHMRGVFETYEKVMVDASDFKLKGDYIIFKKGFRSVAFFHADYVYAIWKEGEQPDAH